MIELKVLNLQFFVGYERHFYAVCSDLKVLETCLTVKICVSFLVNVFDIDERCRYGFFRFLRPKP